jgi:transcriptional regulator with XRE-family HTH domain
MGNEKMARFICDLRKSKNLTQRQLADQLHVTDKAVSKWERGLSCPDISLLPALSDILGVTTRELLNGEKAIESAPETETIVKKTLAYADTAAKSQLRKSRFAFALVVSAISLIAIIICIICNYAIEGGLSWAWYPISSIIFVLMVTMPILLSSKKRIILSITVFSVLIIPFLLAIDKITGLDGLLMPIGLRISLIAILYIWFVYFLFHNNKLCKYVSFAITLFASLPFAWGINMIISGFIGQPVTDIWDVLSYSILAVIGILIFLVGYIKNKSVIKKS